MIEKHDFTDETKWSDERIVDYHNELVDIIESDPMPRIGAQALRQLGIVRFEIDQRILEISKDDNIQEFNGDPADIDWDRYNV